MRTCVGCRTRRPAAEMERYRRDLDGTVRRDEHLAGRGAWLCPGASCLRAAIERRRFPRAFRAEVADRSLAELLEHHHTRGNSPGT